MKQVLLLLLLFASVKDFACSTKIAMTQKGWRWRNNDGSETSATWKADQSTPITYSFSNDVVRLRVELINNTWIRDSLGRCAAGNINPVDSLQYSATPIDEGSWRNIGANAAAAFVMAGINNFMAQNDTTSPQITGTSSTFSPGKIMVTDTVFKNITIRASDRTEVEWAIKGTPNMLPNTTYYFRHRGSTNTYTVYPLVTFAVLTTTAPLPVKITRFAVKADGSKAQLEWATATEQNNDRFEVQRSPDQRTWQTVATVKGKGNSTTPVSYTAYDDKPLNGTAYYRLQQFDKDGKSTVSEIRFFRVSGGRTSVSVWPNPVKDIISFSLGNTGTAKLDAVLSDAGGKIIYRQTFTSVVPNGINKIIPLQQPAPGLYLLQLKGDGLSESVKVVVQ